MVLLLKLGISFLLLETLPIQLRSARFITLGCLSYNMIMNLIWTLWISLTFLGIVTLCGGSPRPDIVNIGALFSFSTIDGDVAKIAMKAAEEDINSNPTVLGGPKLSISMHDSNYSYFLGILGGNFFLYIYL